MNNTVRNLILLITSSLMAAGAFAQNDPWNLGFEQYNHQNQSFVSWTKTAFSDLHYQVEPDSSTVHQGKYALRFQYNPQGKNFQKDRWLTA
ncbi:hypothetical protein [Paraflavitalea speifideaquila]|uniref:hypothetical protein n=1 Tax=Paraflavitalea speifideaquila TaxID=3076558 RepID=UPI0028EBD1D3|nr:hypothetical protein [Paraflavitalea speifideiaquila]